MENEISISKIKDTHEYIIQFQLHNDAIYFRNTINFDMWGLMFTLNRDVIDTYVSVSKTDDAHEYIFTFCNLSKFVRLPNVYMHSNLTKSVQDDCIRFTSEPITNAHDQPYADCISVSSRSDVEFRFMDEHRVVVCIRTTMDFAKDNLPEILEGVMAKMLKTIYSRLKVFIDNFKE